MVLASDVEGPLTRAVHARDASAVRILLAETSVDDLSGEDARTAWGLTAVYGLREIVLLFLDAGLDVDASAKVHPTADANVTPLMLAVRAGQVDTAKFLLDCGANIEARDIIGRTPLFYAVEEQRESTLKLLLDRGADPQARDNEGRTALWYARRRPFLAFSFDVPQWVPGLGGSSFSVGGLTRNSREPSPITELLERAAEGPRAG